MKIAATLFTPIALLAACASVPEAPVAQQPAWPRAGSTWTIQQVTTGSFGTASETVHWRAAGTREWKGQQVIAMDSGPNTWYFDEQKRIVAQLREGKAVATYEPGEAAYPWPLVVGKTAQTTESPAR